MKKKLYFKTIYCTTRRKNTYWMEIAKVKVKKNFPNSAIKTFNKIAEKSK